MDTYNEDSPVKSLTLDISMDDKATVKAGTDVGWLRTKGRGVFMSTEEPQQYRGHDFVGVESQLPPSAFRVMKWKVTDVNEKPSLVRTLMISLLLLCGQRIKQCYVRLDLCGPQNRFVCSKNFLPFITFQPPYHQ